MIALIPTLPALALALVLAVKLRRARAEVERVRGLALDHSHDVERQLRELARELGRDQ